MDILTRVLPAAALLLAACEFTRDPVQLELRGNEVMVHSILAAGSDTVRVLLTRVRAGTGSQPVVETPGSGATVTITGGGASVRLAEAPSGVEPCVVDSFSDRPIAPGCYAGVLPGGVRAGVTYQLSVNLPGHAPIAGTATIPPPPAVRTPGPAARYQLHRHYRGGEPVARIPVAWSYAPGAAGVGAALGQGAVFAGGAAVSGARCRIEDQRGRVLSVAPSDSGAVVVFNPIPCGRGGSVLEVESLHARLLVTAYDRAYVTFFPPGRVPGDAVPRDEFAVGVTGAIGVFAGVATTAVPVTLVVVD